MNIPESFKREVWVNVYPRTEKGHGTALGIGDNHATKADADRASHSGVLPRIACVRVVIEGKEGDGL